MDGVFELCYIHVSVKFTCTYFYRTVGKTKSFLHSFWDLQ